MGKEEPIDSHPVINGWGETWVVPSQVSVVWAVPEPDVGNPHIHMSILYMSPKLSLLLACLPSQCPDSIFLSFFLH
jgi:hypothetical protein